MSTIRIALVVVALICFILAALNVPSPRINLLAAGLASWVASLLL